MFSANTSQVAAGGGAIYVEDVMSTFLYSGTSSTQTITNGIDLSGDGGLVWTKMRNTGVFGNSDHWLFDTARGAEKKLSTNTTDAQAATSGALQQFNSNGYQLGYSGGGYYELNYTGNTYVSWTFRKQPKFFDVVTYTGTGTDGRNIAHSLGAMPACIIVKRTDSTSNWSVYHQGNINGSGSGQNTYSLNTTGAANNLFTVDRTSSTNFNVSDAGAGANSCNVNGATYLAYLFASNAGGFGLTGTDNVISCGSFTKSGSSDVTVNLGFEPQWILMKSSSNAQDWFIFDTMRGMPWSTAGATYLNPNLSAAETGAGPNILLSATGFTLQGFIAGATYIYIAIRRGPMKVPTSGTSVFSPNSIVGSASVTTNFPVDMTISRYIPNIGQNFVFDRLRGTSDQAGITTAYLFTNNTTQENTQVGFGLGYDDNLGYSQNWVAGSQANIFWNFRRAPSFFDEVCYTGTGSATTVTHNLTVAPELMIVKQRNIGGYWMVYPVQLGNKYLVLQRTDAVANGFTGLWNNTAPTSSVFSLGTGSDVNQSGGTYVAYLFATCAGVSKCTAFTGTGSLQTIDCGFTSGARFVLIKRTDSTGDWYVWDSSRGLSSSTDPYLLLNSTAAEVTSTNWVDTTSTGFQVTAASGNNVNINGASYIALAIA